MSSTKDTGSAEEAEEQRLLAQNKSDIEEVLKLIEEQTDRSEAERRLKEAQAKVDARHKGRCSTHTSRGRSPCTITPATFCSSLRRWS